MPIYAYRCEECGFAKDVLQKMSEDPLTICPECQQPAFKKQVTAAGFQLKGSGWYVTDFRGGNSGSAGAAGVTAKSDEQKAASATNEATAGTTASTETNPVASTSNTNSSSVSTKTDVVSGDSKAA
ncbi:FmdB family zinc ribbon protein [Undibacterium sp. Ji22W]|uniref:FmdB family zinc ribbon protein n=1 Tax=Undibacterium sp. Ji22W TaxID=3413038 RepID=UPI003BF35A05